MSWRVKGVGMMRRWKSRRGYWDGESGRREERRRKVGGGRSFG